MPAKSAMPLMLLCLLLVMSGQQSSHAQPGQGLSPSTLHPSVVKVIATNKETGRHQQATGFFINQAGDVVTNYHAIAGMGTIQVWAMGQGGFPVTRILWQDIAADLVILAVRIPMADVHPAPIANHLPLTGEAIEVIGHPLGQQQTRTTGVIRSRFPTPIVDTLLQFTAPISIGESGSPLFDAGGQVVGIVSFILYLGPDKAPSYFAIPAIRLFLYHGLQPSSPH